MRKVLVFMMTAALLCGCAVADSSIQLSEDSTKLTVTLPDGYEWYTEVEDESVVENTSGGEDFDAHTTYMDFSAVEAGSTRIRVSNDSYAVSVAVTADENGKLSIVGVTTAEGSVENIETEANETAPDELTVDINGTGWDYEIENEDVVGADGVVENEESDTSAVTFYGMEPGVSDITLTNGIDEEVVSVMVDEDGAITQIDTTESEENIAFYNTFDAAVSGDNNEVLTLKHSGKMNAAVDDASILAVTDDSYDEASDTWTGVYTAGEDGITDITVSDGENTAVISVFVVDGTIDSYWADCEEAVALKDYLNPNSYDTIKVTGVYTDEEDVYVCGALGTVTENGTEGFDDESDAAILYVSPEAAITLPGVDNAAPADLNSLVSGENAEPVYAAIEMNDDGDIVTFTVTEVK